MLLCYKTWIKQLALQILGQPELYWVVEAQTPEEVVLLSCTVDRYI